jgi:UDP-N-acetylmuramyl pentapeptide synthase
MTKKSRSRYIAHDETLLMALVCGSTVEAAAHKSGLSKRTVYRRLDDPEFRKRLQTYRNDMVTRATGMITAGSMEAVKTLLSLMGTSNSAAARLGAARCVLELGLKLRQATELEERMSIIEERLQKQDDMKTIR